MLNILAIKIMPTKTMLRFYLTPVRMAVIKNTTTNVGEDVGKNKSSYTAGENVNGYKHYQKQYGSSSKN
jgi:hypothetical protein